MELSVSITTRICIFDHNKLEMELTLATDKPVAARKTLLFLCEKHDEYYFNIARIFSYFVKKLLITFI